LTLDLSKLNELWFTLEILLTHLRKRVNECHKLAIGENKKLKEKLQMNLKRIGDHPDKKSLEIVEIPFAIIGTKYDQFEKIEPEKRKIVCKSLRFVSHYYGAMLMFTSNALEATVNKSKALMNNFLFEGSFNR
jgi:dynein light intermediate chain 2, cytosolic